jgi:AcrR family transcriptional regulator
MGAKTEISEQILRAASDRIKHFGYAKTTMAEIAADLRMSAGNLYRFFASKLDIAEALARDQRGKELEELEAIVQRSDIGAREKLALALKSGVGWMQTLVREQPRVVEIADIIARERPQFIMQRLAEERFYLCQILEEGIRTGEFDKPDNIDFLAQCLQASMAKFRMPAMVANNDLCDQNKELEGLLDLLMRGLNRRPPTAP